MNSNKAFTFNDIVLVPDYSDVEHGEIDISTKLFDDYSALPILSSPMDTISGYDMLKAFAKVQCWGVHHRYCELDVLNEASSIGHIAVSPSMGIDNVLKLGYPKTVFFIDVAHGYTKRNLEFAKELVNAGKNVVSGNIVTPASMYDYARIGVRYFRVGIGAGSVCNTRVVTGVGYPQASAVNEIYLAVSARSALDPEFRIISDGGHRSTGDIVKALALGADFVMLGGMLAGTDESLGKKEYAHGLPTFIYRGMASAEALSERKKEFFVEGISVNIASGRGSVIGVLSNIKDAIETACYYLGVRNLQELKEVSYQLITENSHVEGLPYWK